MGIVVYGVHSCMEPGAWGLSCMGAWVHGCVVARDFARGAWVHGVHEKIGFHLPRAGVHIPPDVQSMHPCTPRLRGVHHALRSHTGPRSNRRHTEYTQKSSLVRTSAWYV